MNFFQKIHSILLEQSGSTRPIAAFRILLMLLLWSRFAGDLTLWNAGGTSEVLLGLAFFTLTGASLIGWQTRRAMALLAAVMALMYFHFGIHLGRQPWTHHHVYLLVICTVLCAIGPSERSFSLDRWLAVRANRPTRELGSLTANHLIRLQLASVYFWTAIDKSNFDFLSSARLDQILHFHYNGTPMEVILLWPPLIFLLSVTVVIIEYFLAFAILIQRYTKPVFLIGFSLHLLFYYVLPVSTFSLTMMIMYIMLIPSQHFHPFFDQMLESKSHRMQDSK